MLTLIFDELPDDPKMIVRAVYALKPFVDDEDIWNCVAVILNDGTDYTPDTLVHAFVFKALLTRDTDDEYFVHNELGYGCSPLGFDFEREDSYEEALYLADILWPDLLPGTQLRGKIYKAKGPIYSDDLRKPLSYFVEVQV